MLKGWKVISSNFLALNSSWTNDKDVDTAVVCGQPEKLTNYMNEAGAKTWLLHAKIGRNPRADEEGKRTLWTVLAELKTNFKTMELALQKLSTLLEEVWKTLSDHKLGCRWRRLRRPRFMRRSLKLKP